jgi:hypothetical protein
VKKIRCSKGNFFIVFSIKWKGILSRNLPQNPASHSSCLKTNETLQNTWTIGAEGDGKVSSKQKIELAGNAVKITFQVNGNGKWFRFAPKGDAGKIVGKPKKVGICFYGDGSNFILRNGIVASI